MICHNRMLLRSLSGVACTTPDTSKSQPTAYCFAQLKQGTCLIRLKKISAGVQLSGMRVITISSTISRSNKSKLLFTMPIRIAARGESPPRIVFNAPISPRRSSGLVEISLFPAFSCRSRNRPQICFSPSSVKSGNDASQNPAQPLFCHTRHINNKKPGYERLI